MTSPENRIAVQRDLRPLLKMCLLVAIVLACLGLVYGTPLRDFLALDRVSEWRRMIQRTGPFGHLVYILAGVSLVAVGFPRVAYSAIGGALYGFLFGAMVSQVGAILGSSVSFVIARRLGRDWVRRKTHRRFARFGEHMRMRAFPIMVLARLCPISNNFIVNCVAATSSVPFRTYFLASFLGFIPQTVIFALLGSGLAKERHSQTAISLACFLLMGVVFLLYFRYAKLGVTVANDLSETCEVESVETSSAGPNAPSTKAGS